MQVLLPGEQRAVAARSLLLPVYGISIAGIAAQAFSVARTVFQTQTLPACTFAGGAFNDSRSVCSHTLVRTTLLQYAYLVYRLLYSFSFLPSCRALSNYVSSYIRVFLGWLLDAGDICVTCCRYLPGMYVSLAGDAVETWRLRRDRGRCLATISHSSRRCLLRWQ